MTTGHPASPEHTNGKEMDTPYLAIDLDRVRRNMEELRRCFSLLRPRVFYSVKANASPRVLTTIAGLDCGFDVASIGEIRALCRIGVSPDVMCFSSTIKVPAHIAEAYALGIRLFAFDSEEELKKLSRLAPRARVILRLEVPHLGSRWPLAGKFGATPAASLGLLRSAERLELQPYGLTFHVGSQCVRTASWLDALAISYRVWDEAAKRDIRLQLLNLGGGLPATYTEDVPSIAEIGNTVSRQALRTFGPEIDYAIEPGRFVVADSGTLVTSVIGKARRKNRLWIFVDLSIYTGLLEVIGGWTYPITTGRDDQPKQIVTLAGPSCDSTDIIAGEIELPELEVGDRIALLTAGAYTTAYENYNGLAFPEVVYRSAKSEITDSIALPSQTHP